MDRPTVELSESLYGQLVAIAAEYHRCLPQELHPSDVAATLARLVALGLQQMSTAGAATATQAKDYAALVRRLQQAEGLMVQLQSAVSQANPGQAEVLLRQVWVRLEHLERRLQALEPTLAPEPISPELNLPEQLSELTVAHQGLQQALADQMQDYELRFSRLKQRLDAIAPSQIDLYTAFEHQRQRLSQTQQQLQQLQATVEQLQTTLEQQASPRSAAFSQPSPGRAASPGTAAEYQAPVGAAADILEAEIIAADSLSAEERAELRQQQPIDLDGITQLELCQRFGLSHHSLVHDSRRAGYESVPAYLEARTGYQARRVGRWWRYFG